MLTGLLNLRKYINLWEREKYIEIKNIFLSKTIGKFYPQLKSSILG